MKRDHRRRYADRYEAQLRLQFCFEDGLAGCFEEEAYPHSPGRYRYMPFRSGSHRDLGQALLRGGGPARCTFTEGTVRFEFLVSAIPEYGVLEIQSVVPS